MEDRPPPGGSLCPHPAAALPEVALNVSSAPLCLRVPSARARGWLRSPEVVLAVRRGDPHSSQGRFYGSEIPLGAAFRTPRSLPASFTLPGCACGAGTCAELRLAPVGRHGAQRLRAPPLALYRAVRSEPRGAEGAPSLSHEKRTEEAEVAREQK